jgi:hypothetical protein
MKTCQSKTPDGASWERQPGESDEAYEAFRTYLNLGANRSVAKVGQKCSKSKSLMDRWSAQWNWVERVRAHDNFLMEQEDREQATVVRKWVKNVGKAAADSLAMANKDLEAYAKKGKATKLVNAERLIKISTMLHDRQRAMHTLSVHEQAQLELQHARLDLEYTRLEASLPPPTGEESGNALIEALNAKAADFFPQYVETKREENKDE